MAHGIGAGEDFPSRVHELTDGFGADAVLITAATESDEVVRQAMQACRKKGRVVLVGDVGLHLQRADIYEKELDFLISTSYGPGRYDDVYEQEGQDYPIGYVRWTENRNMEEYLAPARRGPCLARRARAAGVPGRRGRGGLRVAQVGRCEAAARPALLPGAATRPRRGRHASGRSRQAGQGRRRPRRRRRLRAGPAPAEPDQAARRLRAAGRGEPHRRQREGRRRARRGRRTRPPTSTRCSPTRRSISS